MFQSPYATLVLMWIIFAFIHSGLASNEMVRGMGRRMGKYYRPAYSLLVLVVLLLLIHYHFSAIETILFSPHWILKIISGILSLSGFVVIVVSLWTNLLAATGISLLLGIDTQQGFSQDGLHRYVRHPLYTGVLFFLWGVFFGYPYQNNLVSAVCFTIFLGVGIYFLEKKLLVQYGDEYRAYQKRVPRVLPRRI